MTEAERVDIIGVWWISCKMPNAPGGGVGHFSLHRILRTCTPGGNYSTGWYLVLGGNYSKMALAIQDGTMAGDGSRGFTAAVPEGIKEALARREKARSLCLYDAFTGRRMEWETDLKPGCLPQ